jgi:hypothetical protein
MDAKSAIHWLRALHISCDVIGYCSPSLFHATCHMPQSPSHTYLLVSTVIYPSNVQDHGFSIADYVNR